MINMCSRNTLQFNQSLCNNCHMCITVCPHAVFEKNKTIVYLAHPERCMECGACQLNCLPGAITVDSGVGCATAMIHAALTGKKETTCRCC
jgi:NAD-dependent dihydropyrimidine dehydrogenase PreA subunit